MKDKIAKLISTCSQINFGPVNFSDGEAQFCSELNKEVISLCKSLPKSTHADALLFIMRYWGIPFGHELDFFRYYYVPSWSIIYWLAQYASNTMRIDRVFKRNANTAHSMALFLHALDDHLNDSQIPTTHLSLLLRSQSWRIMNDALYRLVDGIDEGHKTVLDFLDDYYSSIMSLEDVESLDTYCNLFRKQIATWFIVPTLMAKKLTSDEGFIQAIQTAHGSFTISWRLLDDIQDIEEDIMEGVHSSIYVCLDEALRGWWDKGPEGERDQDSGFLEAVVSYVLENRVIDAIKERACSELESAASIAGHWDLTALADEYRSLLKPLRGKGTAHERDLRRATLCRGSGRIPQH